MNISQRISGQVIIQYVERAKDCLARKKRKKKAASLKLQALTMDHGQCRMNL